MPFFLVENPLNKKTVTKTEKYIQTSRQGKVLILLVRR